MRHLKHDLWPYQVKVNSDFAEDITLVEMWLGENMGGFKDRWNVVYMYNQTVFYFRTKQDATLFALKWS